MKIIRNILIKIGAVSALFVLPLSAFAGSTGGMGFGTAANIPTLSGTMLIVLSILLFAVAVRVAKQKNSGINKMFVTLLGVGAISLITGGAQLVSKADAGLGSGVPGLVLNTSATTGSVVLFSNTTHTFTNENAANVIINSITPPPGNNCGPVIGSEAKPAGKLAAAPPPVNVTTCSVGLSIKNLDGCELFCGFVISDIRLKNTIKPLTKLDNDIQLYSFKYNGENNQSYVGVMAQEVMQDARYKHSVKKMPNSYYAVNYHSLGLKMISLKQWQKSPQAIFRDR